MGGQTHPLSCPKTGFLWNLDRQAQLTQRRPEEGPGFGGGAWCGPRPGPSVNTLRRHRPTRSFARRCLQVPLWPGGSGRRRRDAPPAWLPAGLRLLHLRPVLAVDATAPRADAGLGRGDWRQVRGAGGEDRGSGPRKGDRYEDGVFESEIGFQDRRRRGPGFRSGTGDQGRCPGRVCPVSGRRGGWELWSAGTEPALCWLRGVQFGRAIRGFARRAVICPGKRGASCRRHRFAHLCLRRGIATGAGCRSPSRPSPDPHFQPTLALMWSRSLISTTAFGLPSSFFPPHLTSVSPALGTLRHSAFGLQKCCKDLFIHELIIGAAPLPEYLYFPPSPDHLGGAGGGAIPTGLVCRQCCILFIKFVEMCLPQHGVHKNVTDI